MDHRTLRALDEIHLRDPAMAHIQTEQLIHLQAIRDQLKAAKASTSSPIISNTGINFSRLLQWPMPLYLISAGLLAANYKIPEIAELIRAFVSIQ